MESTGTCKYYLVDSELDNKSFVHNKHIGKWTPFFRQLLVCTAVWTVHFVTGLSLGAPTVVIPQLRRSNTTVSDEMASWLSSALSYSAMPWVIIYPIISERVGRKIPFFFAVTASIVSFFIFYFSKTTAHFLISQITHGMLFGLNLTITVIIVTEYTSPKYRGIFLTLKSASIWWGVWASNAIGTFFIWNYIGLFGLICSTFYATVFIWPESPYWLATKGRFDECVKAHRWLKGVDESSEDELRNLILAQQKYSETLRSQSNSTCKENLQKVSKIIKNKEYYMPILLSVLVMAQYHASGKVVCVIYAIELIKKITESESTAYTGMLILDGISVLGMYCGSFLSKFVSRRSLLIRSSVSGIVFLFLMSLYTWLIEQSLVKENKIISVFLLGTFSISISCGPMIMSTSIYAELIPIRFKTSAIIITILTHFSLQGTSIKIAPLIFKTLRMHGTFCLYGILASILTFVLYKYLPETKDKTLQEIEEYFKDRTKNQESLPEAEELVNLSKK